jgi:hypothetical protein
MKKLFVVLVAIVLVASFASAQSVWGQGKMSAGAGLELGLPTGDFGNIAGTGIGGLGLFQYGLNEDVLLTGQIGYTSWGTKNNYGSISDLAILVGGKYNLSKQVTPGFYGMVQIGIYSVSWTAPSYTAYGITVGGGSVSDSKFVIIPGVGYQFGPIDASVKYVLNSDVGNFALNVAYIFPL